MKKLVIIVLFIAMLAIAGCFDFKNEQQQQLPPQIQKWLELYGDEAEE